MRARSFVGPALMAAGVWCAAGQISVLSAGDPSVRVGIPASLLWIPLAGVLAWLIPGFRRTPVPAAPAVLAVLPWFPIPLPSIALVWTGRLAWLPVGLAVLAAIGMGRSRRQTSTPEGGAESPGAGSGASRHPRSHALAAACLSLAAAIAVAWSLAPRLPGGDEPHYLIITQSLLKDGDIRIANNHANRDYAAYFAGDLRPDKIQDGRNGEVYSIHAPGTSVLVLPAFAALGYRGAQLTIVLLAAMTGGLVWYAGWLAARDAASAWVAWAAVAASTTFLFQSVTIFPDGPGAFVAAVALVVSQRLASETTKVGMKTLGGTGALLAALPWLHTRFSVLAAGLALVLLWQMTRDERPMRGRLQRMAVLLVVPLVSAAGWFLFFQTIYGTPNPSAPYGPDPQTSLSYIPGGLIALLFDQQFGLLAVTPVLAAAFAGVFVAHRARDEVRSSVGLARAGLLVALAYFAAVAVYWMWWAGVPATPARFSSAALPLLAPAIALALYRARASRPIWCVLLAVSLAASTVLLFVDRGALAWNSRQTARAAWLDWTGAVANVPRGLPSFFWRLDPGRVASEVGFAVHVALTAAIFLALGLVIVAFVRHRRSGGSTAASWWFLVSSMAAVQAGWWLNHAPPLDAAHSQMRVLTRVAEGRTSFEIHPGRWQRAGTPALRIDVARELETSAPAWSLENVPAGRYRIDAEPPAAGAVSLRMGRFELASVELSPAGSGEFALPAGARTLNIAALTGDVLARGTLEVVPLAVLRDAGPPARAFLSYGRARVFFLDDQAFPEPDGFWIRGASTSRFVLESAGRTATIELSNGPMANAVALDDGRGATEVRFQPSESRAVVVPLDASGIARVRITSPAGFRPSNTGGSRDSRYLGVRVSVGP